MGGAYSALSHVAHLPILEDIFYYMYYGQMFLLQPAMFMFIFLYDLFSGHLIR